MEFEFDPAKDETNRFKHGLRLAFGERVFDDPWRRVLPSFREEDREERYKTVGLVEGKLYTVVYVVRETATRLISVRRSNAGEQRDYDRHSGRPERS
jgi:uncharacterized DUF497 family protein